MQANVRVKAKEDVDKQKEKERKREEKELRKIAAANGIKMAKTPSSTLAVVSVPESGNLATAPGMGMSANTNISMDIDGGNPVTESKTDGGWAPLSAPVHSQGGFKKSGWATIGPSSSNSSAPPSQSAPVVDQPPSNIASHRNPTFRNGGWSSLDTGSSHPLPVTNQTSETSSSSHGGGGWSNLSRDESGYGQRWQGSTEPIDPIPPPEVTPPPIPLETPKPAQVPQAKPPRSNWQQFQKGASRRK